MRPCEKSKRNLARIAARFSGAAATLPIDCDVSLGCVATLRRSGKCPPSFSQLWTASNDSGSLIRFLMERSEIRMASVLNGIDARSLAGTTPTSFSGVAFTALLQLQAGAQASLSRSKAQEKGSDERHMGWENGFTSDSLPKRQICHHRLGPGELALNDDRRTNKSRLPLPISWRLTLEERERSILYSPSSERRRSSGASRSGISARRSKAPPAPEIRSAWMVASARFSETPKLRNA